MPRSSLSRALIAAAALAIGLALGGYYSGIFRGLESRTLDARFSLRPAHTPNDVLVVGVDDTTFNDLNHPQWPFPRSWHGRVIDQLKADGAKAIAFDVQFSEPTTPRQDNALYRAVERARNVVLATSDVSSSGHTDVLGGDANLARAHSLAAAASFPPDPGPVLRRYNWRALGLPTLAVAAVQVATSRRVAAREFGRNGALIDFRGPPGTIKTVHYSEVLQGHLDPSLVKGRIVVVGATSPTLGDVHATSTTSGTPMSGPEVQANAIWTALHGNPLHAAPGWLAIVAIVLLGLAAPLTCFLRLRPLLIVAVSLALAGAYLGIAQAAFGANTIIVVVAPLAALTLGTVAAVVAGFAAEARERRRVSLYAGRLEVSVRRGRRQLREAQLEIVQRLTQAAESRDEHTGEHIHRMSELCGRLGQALGMSRAEAERLRHASAMHDVGKIGIPDRVLLKPAKLDPEEWEIMKTHTTRGGEILAGSSSPLVQMAETIALTHHERWDGSGYPAGLKGEEIPLVGRICAVCDVFDALLSKRPYKESWSMEETLSQLRADRGTHFDPQVLDVFLELVGALTPQLVDETPSAAVQPVGGLMRPAGAVAGVGGLMLSTPAPSDLGAGETQ